MRDLHAEMSRLYGRRLKGLFLYGSHARGDACTDSDLDVLVVLDRITHYPSEIDLTSSAVSDLSLRYNTSISRVFVTLFEWERTATPFLVNARSEAVPA